MEQQNQEQNSRDANLPRKRHRGQEASYDSSTNDMVVLSQEKRLLWARQGRRLKLENDKLKEVTAKFCFKLRRAQQEKQGLKERIQLLEASRGGVESESTSGEPQSATVIQKNDRDERKVHDDSETISPMGESLRATSCRKNQDGMKAHYEQLLEQERKRLETELREKHARKAKEIGCKHAHAMQQLREQLAQQTRACREAERRERAFESEATRLRETLKHNTREVENDIETTPEISQYEGYDNNETRLQARVEQLEERVEELETENVCLLGWLENLDQSPREPQKDTSDSTNETSTNRRRKVRCDDFDNMCKLLSTLVDQFEDVDVRKLSSWASNWKCRLGSSTSASHVDKRICLDKIGFFSPDHNWTEVPPDQHLVDGVSVAFAADSQFNKMFKLYQEVGRKLGTYGFGRLERWIQKWIAICDENQNGDEINSETAKRIEKVKVLIDRANFTKVADTGSRKAKGPKKARGLVDSKIDFDDEKYKIASDFVDQFGNVDLKQLSGWVATWKSRLRSVITVDGLKISRLHKLGFFAPDHNAEEVAADRPLVNPIPVERAKDVTWNKMFKLYQEVGRKLGTNDVGKLEKWLNRWISYLDRNKETPKEALHCESEKMKALVDSWTWYQTTQKDKESVQKEPQKDNKRIDSFSTKVKQLDNFRAKFGRVRVPRMFDRQLHMWEATTMANFLRHANGNRVYSPEEFERLKAIKLMDCKPAARGPGNEWKQMVDLLLAYKEKKGDCMVLPTFDRKLHEWILDQEGIVGESLADKDTKRRKYLEKHGLLEPIRKAVAVNMKSRKRKR